MRHYLHLETISLLSIAWSWGPHSVKVQGRSHCPSFQHRIAPLMCWGAKGALGGPKKCKFAEGSRAKSFDGRMGLVFEIWKGRSSEMSTLLKISESAIKPFVQRIYLIMQNAVQYLCSLLFCLFNLHHDLRRSNSKSKLCHRAYINVTNPLYHEGCAVYFVGGVT